MTAEATSEVATDRVRTISVRGIQVRVSERPASGRLVDEPPLLLCNGIGVSLEALQPLVDHLDPARGVVRFDVPGVGGSPAPPFPYPIAALSSWVTALMARLGHRRFDVLGLSWGGGLGPAARRAVAPPGPPRRPGRHRHGRADGAGQSARVLARMSTPRRHRDPAYAARIAAEIYGGSMRTHPERGADLLHATTRSGPKRGYYYQLAAMTGWSSLPFLCLISAADPGDGRRRRPDHPVGQPADAGTADPARAAAPLPRRPPRRQ